MAPCAAWLLYSASRLSAVCPLYEGPICESLTARVRVQFARSQEALDYLAQETDAAGRRLEVVKVPLPPVQHYTQVPSCRTTSKCF